MVAANLERAELGDTSRCGSDGWSALRRGAQRSCCTMRHHGGARSCWICATRGSRSGRRPAPFRCRRAVAAGDRGGAGAAAARSEPLLRPAEIDWLLSGRRVEVATLRPEVALDRVVAAISRLEPLHDGAPQPAAEHLRGHLGAGGGGYFAWRDRSKCGGALTALEQGALAEHRAGSDLGNRRAVDLDARTPSRSTYISSPRAPCSTRVEPCLSVSMRGFISPRMRRSESSRSSAVSTSVTSAGESCHPTGYLPRMRAATSCLKSTKPDF